MKCPHCQQVIDNALIAAEMGRVGGAIGGKSTSEAKRKASAENGKRGGRPKKNTSTN